MSICPADNRPCDKVPCPLRCGSDISPAPTPPTEPTDEWWARRWLKGASDGEKAAMRRLLV